MSPIEEIKAILRECVSSQDGYEADYRAQLAAIESLESDAAALRKALEPFASEAERLLSVSLSISDTAKVSVSFAALRNAMSAVKGGVK